MTIQHINLVFQAEGLNHSEKVVLLTTKRRVDPRTGESIPNLTRINLSLLESMRRAPKEYDDNLVGGGR